MKNGFIANIYIFINYQRQLLSTKFAFPTIIAKNNYYTIYERFKNHQ